jgi:uncharacterized protein (DUF4415 family)
MPVKPSVGPQPWTDPDDAPELTEAYFERAAVYDGETLIRPGKPRGRPRSAAPKKLVSLRIDPVVLAAFRATGSGWQTRINIVLMNYLGRLKRKRPAARGGRLRVPRKSRG